MFTKNWKKNSNFSNQTFNIFIEIFNNMKSLVCSAPCLLTSISYQLVTINDLSNHNCQIGAHFKSCTLTGISFWKFIQECMSDWYKQNELARESIQELFRSVIARDSASDENERQLEINSVGAL